MLILQRKRREGDTGDNGYTSSLNEISTDQLSPYLQMFKDPRNRFRKAGNRFLAALKGLQVRALGNGGGGIYPLTPLSLQQDSGLIFIDDVNGFSFTSDICFMSYTF